NAKDLASYAVLCQEAGLVPIVEPEVLMDWKNDIEGCRDATERTLTAVFEELVAAGVAIEGMVLKPNMVIPGKESGIKASPEEVAEATVRLFRKVLPKELVGAVFLSGGQSEIEATENLNAMNKLELEQPWKLSFSYGRALQDSAIKLWSGNAANAEKAKQAFIHRAHMNSLATVGKYEGETHE
ncbi:MAG: fructose-bisphosphate aldolase, partial [Patescibacteria group bacterium]|nr:fructose-bisphosphate aldolase [Patescibacteria group bacterium]